MRLEGGWAQRGEIEHLRLQNASRDHGDRCVSALARCKIRQHAGSASARASDDLSCQTRATQAQLEGELQDPPLTTELSLTLSLTLGGALHVDPGRRACRGRPHAAPIEGEQEMDVGDAFP
jgi:hypothetical protein